MPDMRFRLKDVIESARVLDADEEISFTVAIHHAQMCQKGDVPQSPEALQGLWQRAHATLNTLSPQVWEEIARIRRYYFQDALPPSPHENATSPPVEHPVPFCDVLPAPLPVLPSPSLRAFITREASSPEKARDALTLLLLLPEPVFQRLWRNRSQGRDLPDEMPGTRPQDLKALVSRHADRLLPLRNTFLGHNYRLALAFGRAYDPDFIPEEDQFQEAVIGMIQALRRFDPYRGTKFSTYATHWIQQAVQRHGGAQVFLVSASHAAREHRLPKLYRALIRSQQRWGLDGPLTSSHMLLAVALELGEIEPQDRDTVRGFLLGQGGLPEALLQRYKDTLNRLLEGLRVLQGVQSLDQGRERSDPGHEGEEGRPLSAWLVDDETPESRLLESPQETHALLLRLIEQAGLGPRERSILVLYHGLDPALLEPTTGETDDEGLRHLRDRVHAVLEDMKHQGPHYKTMSFRQIGRVLGMSGEGVRQAYLRALDRLRRAARAEALPMGL